MKPQRWYLVSPSGQQGSETGIAYVIDGPTEIGWEREWLKTHAPARLRLDDGIATDYLENDVGWSLCSKKLRGVIDGSTADEVSWTEALVISGDETLQYYILDCQYRPDVIDKQKSIFHNDILIKRVFDAQILGSQDIFRYFDDLVGGLCVSENIKQRLIETGCTGITFNPLPLA